MFAVVLLSTLAVPFAPVPSEPAADGWTTGAGAFFSVTDYADDAGIAAAGLRIEFRAADAGYGSLTDTTTSQWGLNTTHPFAGEGARWCWRAYHRNTLGQEGPPSVEQCFRTDWTPPVSPRMDAGAMVASLGRLVIPYTPGSDALSGIEGYQLRVSPVGLDDFSSFVTETSLANPFVSFLGEGSWEYWLESRDRAFNLPPLGNQPKPVVVVTADQALPVPAAPVFEETVTNGYGSAITWDAGIPGAEFWVVSFCNLDAGCVWRDGFNSRPASRSAYAWVQMEDEGTMVARVAVVVNGLVSRWSAPSQPVKIDRTSPGDPTGLLVTPTAARMGPLTLSWNAVPPDFVGPVTVFVEETSADGGVGQFQVDAGVSMVSLTRGEGRWRYRIMARDLAANTSGWVGPATATLDSTGPSSQQPSVLASAVDGGARVTVTWSTPVDALSTVSTMALQERSEDGGSTVVVVTGNSTQRPVGPGRWRWAIRGTDSLGNVGAFSVESAPVDVGAAVGVGPSVATNAFTLQCGAPGMAQLSGAGDAPLSWQLISGPPGAMVSTSGLFTWTVPAGLSGSQTMTVSLTNPVSSVRHDIRVTVECVDAGVDAGAEVDAGTDAGTAVDAGAGVDAGTDAGTTVDAGVVDAGAVDAGAVDAGAVDAGVVDGGHVEHRDLLVGCGCTSTNEVSAMFLLLAAWAVRRSRRLGS